LVMQDRHDLFGSKYVNARVYAVSSAHKDKILEFVSLRAHNHIK